jgi:hypothetical protein
MEEFLALEKTPYTSPDLDAVCNEMLKNLPPSLINFLLSMLIRILHEYQSLAL